MTVVTKTCSGCGEPFTIDTAKGEVSMTIPSNGKRGSLFVPAQSATVAATVDRHETLFLWDCLVCGYAESEYVDDETREGLT